MKYTIPGWRDERGAAMDTAMNCRSVGGGRNENRVYPRHARRVVVGWRSTVTRVEGRRQGFTARGLDARGYVLTGWRLLLEAFPSGSLGFRDPLKGPSKARCVDCFSGSGKS